MKNFIKLLPLCLLFAATPAMAANLYFSPSTGSYPVGSTLSVAVYVSSADQAMNAASGVVTFPEDKLAVTSLSKAGSIFSLWVQEPSYSSNSEGQVNFEGVVLNPGFKSSQGKIITINFRVKSAGRASLSFSSGQVLANDGSGTSILTGMGTAGFSLTSAPVQTAPALPDHFNIRELARSDGTEPRARFFFDVGGRDSGVAHYEVGTDDSAPIVWNDDGSHIYETDVTPPGKHTLLAKAVLKDGNYLAASADFTIDPLATPVISVPAEIQSGEPMIVKGRTKYPNAKVVIWLQGGAGQASSQIVQTDDKGDFMAIVEESSREGDYKLWAVAVDDRGARSNPTDKLTITVQPPAFLSLGSLAVSMLSVIISILALILLLLFILWHCWRKFSELRKKLRRDVHDTEAALHKAFDLLKEDVHEQVKLLENAKTRRELTAEEEKIVKQLKKDLDDAEGFMKKEIQGIEKDINK